MTREEAIEIRRALWHPGLVDEAIRRTATARDRKCDPTEASRWFLRPAQKLQETYPAQPELVRYALKEALRWIEWDQPEAHKGYARYFRKVAARHAARFPASDPAERIAAQDGARISELAARAAELNGRGESEQARMVLAEMLALTPRAASALKATEAEADQKLRLAFKYGTSDWRGAEVDPYGLDFYPEWTPAGV